MKGLKARMMTKKNKKVHIRRKRDDDKSFPNSILFLLKYDIDKYPWLESAMKYVQNVTIVLKRLRFPYSSGRINFAKRISKKKLIPWLKKEKNEKREPFTMVLLSFM
jgi:hypothetical protein